MGRRRGSLTSEKEYMRLVLRERGADHAWITAGSTPSGGDAIRSESELTLRVSDGTRRESSFPGFAGILLIR